MLSNVLFPHHHQLVNPTPFFETSPQAPSHLSHVLFNSIHQLLIMTATILTLFLLLKIVFSYSLVQNQDSINLETNIAQIVHTVFTPHILYPQYTVTFSQQFASTPMIITNVRGVFNCFPEKNQFFVLRQGFASSSTSGFVIRSRVSISRGYDPNMILKVYYLVSEFKNTNIIVDNYVRTDVNVPNYTSIITVSLTQYKESIFQTSNVYLSCFVSGIYCKQSTSTFVFKNRCYKVGNSSFAYQTETTAIAPNGCDRYDVYLSYMIVFPQTGRYTTISGSFTVTPTQPNPLGISSAQPNTIFIIGLISLETPDACLEFQLANNNTEIDTTYNNYISLEFQYLQMTYISTNPLLEFRTFYYYPFSDKVTYYFYNLSFYHMVYSSKSNVFSSTFQFSDRSEEYCYAKVLNPIPDDVIYYTFYLIGNKYNQKVVIYRKIIFAPRMEIDINRAKIAVYLRNTDYVATTKNITFGTSNYYVLKQVINLNSTSTLVKFQFTNRTEIGDVFTFFYRSTHNYNKTLTCLVAFTFTQFQYNLLESSFKIVLAGIPNSQNVQLSQFTWISSSTSNPSITNRQSKLLELKFDHSLTDTTSLLQFMFVTNTNSKFQIHFTFVFVAVDNVQFIHHLKECRVAFRNFSNNPKLDQFQILPTTINKLSLQFEGNLVILVLDYSAHPISQEFQIKHKSDQYHLTSVVTNIKIPPISTKSNDIPQLIVILNDQYTPISNISLIDSPFQIISTTYQPNHDILITLPNIEDLHGTILKIRLEYPKSSSYQMIHLQLDTMLCIGDFAQQSMQYQYVSITIVCLYWTVFLTGIVFYQKIYAIETMFTLQFAYLSFIPTNIYCQPFAALGVLKYSFGWNDLPLGVSDIPISSYYSSLGFQSNFLSNFNFMLILSLLLPLLSPLFLVLGKNSEGYRAKPRLIAMGKSLLLDIPFTVILFNAPNIVSSFVISLQAYGTVNLGSFIASCISLILVLIAPICFCIFQNSFRQYKQQFCTRLQLCGISISKSTKIRSMYPLILWAQIVGVSTVLSMKSLLDISLYLSLGMLLFLAALKLIMLPYNHSIDNARLLIHQFFLISINCLQIGFHVLKSEHKSKYNTVYQFPWAIQVILIIAVLGNSFPYLIYKSTLWFKSRGLIDLSLYNKSHTVPTKTPYSKKRPENFSSSSSYPALEFSIYKHNRNRLGQSRQELLKVNRINQDVGDTKQGISWEQSLL